MGHHGGMSIVLSVVVLMALAVVMAALYSLLFDPKNIDAEELRVARRRHRRRERLRGIVG